MRTPIEHRHALVNLGCAMLLVGGNARPSQIEGNPITFRYRAIVGRDRSARRDGKREMRCAEPKQGMKAHA